jgi:dihydrofolate reductase
MKLSLIAAVDRNGGIGKNNQLLWHEPQDQRHFRSTTLGCPVVMGRKTWDSLPVRNRPLPGRRNVVLTRNAGLQCPGAEMAGSLDEALLRLAHVPQVFVMGGAEIYAQALPLADELLLTEVDANLDGDAHFPAWPREDFEVSQHVSAIAADGTPFAFVTYRRKRA